MRPFGTDVSDLDVNFSSRSPFVVTELLRRCASLPDDAVWRLPVGARTEAIVNLATLSTSRALDIQLCCPACREALEVEIEASELRAWCAGTACDSITVALPGGTVTLRRPTGEDQRNWLRASWPDAETARRAMLATLLDPPLEEALGAVDTLENELSRIDPLVGFKLSVACPACGEAADHPLDLEQHALAALRKIHERLFEGVASLAARFHWTEADIFALPAWRRERYLAFVEATL